MKKLKRFFTLFFLISNFWGLIWAEKNNLFSVKTDWFEIIYPKECEASANILYENVDKIYEDVNALYNLKPVYSMPIVLIPSVDSFNAFWTSVPYNHIVIYDTSVSLNSEISYFSNTLLQTFRHEITHAVTFNMKNSFWDGVGRVMGDCISPASLWISSGMAEGATLTSESKDGEGRLNNEYSKHLVKQAKIEGKFPSYYDVIGCGDRYPVGSFYQFNGAFHQWLQKKYGMEKYTQFWYKLVNLQAITVGVAFKKIYEIELKKAWKLFIDDYKIPNVTKNPLDSGFVQDFFNESNNDFSKENKVGSYLFSLTKSKNSIAWIDSYGGKVKYLSLTDGKNDKKTVKTLLSLKKIDSINLSENGRFLVISYFKTYQKKLAARTKIYDFENSRFFDIKTQHIKECAIIQKDDNYYLLGTKYSNAKNNLYIEEVLFDNNGKICGTNFVNQVDFPLTENFGNIIQTENGQFAYIKQKGVKYFIVNSDLDGNLIYEYELPIDKMIVNSLSYDSDDKTFYFSWTSPGTMPRLGKLEILTKQFFLSDENGDLSGGIFNPIFIDNQIIYLGQFYRFSRILQIPDVSAFFDYNSSIIKCESFAYHKFDSSYSDQIDNVTSLNSSEILFEDNYSDFIPKSQKFNSWKYLFDGIFLPFSVFTPESFGTAIINPSAYNYAGVSFITSQPWSDGSNFYTSTFGWNLFNNSFGISIYASDSILSNLISTNYELKTEFNSEGWKYCTGMINNQLTFQVGNVSSLYFENTVNGKIRHQSIYDSSENKVYYSVGDTFVMSFSNVNAASSNRNEKKGILYQLGISYLYDSELSSISQEYVNSTNIIQNLYFYVPRLIPVISNYQVTASLPTRIGFSFTPASSVYSRTNYANLGSSIIDFGVESVLFGIEVQKSIPFFQALYVNNFSLNVGYFFSLASGYEYSNSNFHFYKNFPYEFKRLVNNEFYYLDYLSVEIITSLSPNIGNLASGNSKTNLILLFQYCFQSKYLSAKKNFNPFSFSIGFSVN